MTVRVAINGFGRIGRLVLRSIVEHGRLGQRHPRCATRMRLGRAGAAFGCRANRAGAEPEAGARMALGKG